MSDYEMTLTAPPLSRRQQEVVDLYTNGFSAKWIAARLFISPRTVETHLQHVYGKLGLSCRDELAEYMGGYR